MREISFIGAMVSLIFVWYSILSGGTVYRAIVEMIERVPVIGYGFPIIMILFTWQAIEEFKR